MDNADHASLVDCAPAQTELASISPKRQHVDRNPPWLTILHRVHPLTAYNTTAAAAAQRTSVSPNLSVLVTNSSGVMGSPYSCCTAPACNNKHEKGRQCQVRSFGGRPHSCCTSPACTS